MLHQFTIKNFKSFKDEVTLDLTASTLKELPSDVVSDVMHEPVLKLAAIYGANASGKSNVIKAFSTMVYAVLSSLVDEMALSKVTPYWFEDGKVPTEFTVLFSTATDIFQYQFSTLQGKVYEESLYQRDKRKVSEHFVLIFERDGGQLTGEIAQRADVQTLEHLISPETLLLSMLSRLEIPVIKSVFAWFKQVQTLDYGNPRSEINKMYRFNSQKGRNPMISLLEDPHENADFEAFIQAVDVGISKIGVVTDDFLDDSGQAHKRVVSYHRDPRNGQLVQTAISDESSGTRKMLMLYVDLKQALANGGTILIDELDAKLHPLLLRYILIMFHDPQLNLRGAQLIFTTQELFTLDKDNFRRDEVWFVNKDESGDAGDGGSLGVRQAW